MKSSEKLDLVLNYLQNDRPPIHDIGEIRNNILKQRGISLQEIETILILNKLIEDKFATSDDRIIIENSVSTKRRFYSTTFEGKLLIEEGGYVNDINKKNIFGKYQGWTTWSIILGGMLAAIYYTLEIIKTIVPFL